MTARGTSGQLKHGYRTVAALSSWSLTGGFFESAATEVDQFEIGQAMALDLELTVGRQRWVWRGVAPMVSGDRCSATLVGKPEIR